MTESESFNARLLALERELHAWIKRAQDDRDGILSKISVLEKDTAVSNERYGQILREISNIAKKIEELSSVPQGRWNTVVTSLISAVTGGGLTLILSRILGG